ncbi:MAG: extracellular solute-binding protein, partial [Roseiflexaceae bacterium]|nr:extracellular solute-binding protein [Roseiflexaceae bacterium]
PQAGWSVEDLLATAEQLTDREANPPRYGFAGNTLDDLQTFFDSTGAGATTRENRQLQPNYASPAVQQAIQQFAALTRDASPYQRLVGYVRSQAVGNAVIGKPNEVERATYLANNQVAMWYTYATPQAEGASAPAALAPLPATWTPSIDTLLLSGMAIHRSSSAPEACWKFMQALGDAPVEQFGFAARRSLAEAQLARPDAAAGAAEVYQALATTLQAEKNQSSLRASDEEQAFEYFWLMRAADRIVGEADASSVLAEAQSYTERYLVCVRGDRNQSLCAKEADPTFQGYR